jgi:enamine deaminase RidA (YjgF/YER057c/UK114 family)
MMFSKSPVLRSSFNQLLKRSINVEARIIALGHDLPPLPPAAAGTYMIFVRSGNMIYLSGHLPIPPPSDGRTMLIGRLGENYTIEQGQEAAKICGLQLLASMKAAVGDLDKIKKVVKLVGFVNCTTDFTNQAQVMNGCSNLMGDVFGEKIGRHARSSLGANVLPFGVPVEIEAVVEVEDE